MRLEPRRGGRFVAILATVLALAGRVWAQAPPRDQGSIRGEILDSASGQPITGASVNVVGVEGARERTDLDGRYEIFVAPGRYELRISSTLYESVVLENVEVKAGSIADASARLKPTVDTTLEVVEVVADVTASTEATQLLKRRMAPTVSDTLGAESISKTPDSDAAEVVTRVPAVTIKDDKFIVVRGLGERYSSARLNGSRLPSTDPNKRVVPLDLFPSNFIESLSIVKSYMPNLPGDFAGGLVDIRLADPPQRFTYGIGLSGSFNTETTFQDFDTYDGTTADWFGFGDKFRDLPNRYGNAPSHFTRSPTTPQMRSLVASLPNNWDIHSTTAPPNFGIDGFVGGKLGPVGLNLAGVYGTKHQVLRDQVINGFQEPALFEQGLGQNYVYDRSTFETTLGAILTTSYDYSLGHQFAGRALVNRKSTDEVLVGDGKDALFDPDKPVFFEQQEYTTDQLGFGQIEGRHHWAIADLDWRASWAPSMEEQPDTKFTRYELDEGADAPLLNFKQPSTLRTFGTLNEFLQDYYADLTVPFKTRLPFTDVWSGLIGELKSGVAYSLRDRTFDYRRFSTDYPTQTGLIDLSQKPGSILIPSNYADPGDARLLRYRESTRRSDTFEATQEIAGAYGMLELPIVPERLRVVGGARVEYSYINAQGVAILPPEAFQNIINDLDPLPGVTLIYSPLEAMNFRFAYSQTVSRPEFRELTPTQFPSAPGEPTFQGNPNLVSSSIQSFDLRWEWFFSPLELASASVFYKSLDKPIEIVRIPETSNLLDTAINAESAYLWGIELEGRKNFNFLVPYVRRWQPLRGVAPMLADVQISSNVSLVNSEVKGLADDPVLGDILVPTNEKRPLVGQAPFVVNAALEYEHYRWGLWRLLYNTVGETINAGGVDIQPNDDLSGLPDIKQQRRDQLDLVWIFDLRSFGSPIKTKFAVENILNSVYLERQGPQVTNRYTTGVTFSLGASYSF